MRFIAWQAVDCHNTLKLKTVKLFEIVPVATMNLCNNLITKINF